MTATGKVSELSDAVWEELRAGCDATFERLAFGSLDEDRVVGAVRRCYEHIGEDPPRVRFVDGPTSVLRVGAAHPKNQLGDQLRGQIRAQLGDQLGARLRGRLWDQLRDQLWDHLWDHLWDQLWGQLGARLRDQLWDRLWGQLGAGSGAGSGTGSGTSSGCVWCRGGGTRPATTTG